MRHDSERVPGKNYRPFAGRPLYHHIVATLLACPSIAEVIIDTDSPVIQADARACFPQVRVLERPVALRAGTIPMNEILLHDVAQVTADLYLQTHSTNPLLRASTIERALATFRARRADHDSLVGVTPIRARLWDEQGRPLNHDPQVLLRTQDLPPVFEENSNLYLFEAATLSARRNRIGSRPLFFALDRDEAWDIDEEIDFAVAEFLYAQRRSP
jgi:CMP-N-acetylneuraminic acid synthetase